MKVLFFIPPKNFNSPPFINFGRETPFLGKNEIQALEGNPRWRWYRTALSGCSCQVSDDNQISYSRHLNGVQISNSCICFRACVRKYELLLVEKKKFFEKQGYNLLTIFPGSDIQPSFKICGKFCIQISLWT